MFKRSEYSRWLEIQSHFILFSKLRIVRVLRCQFRCGVRCFKNMIRKPFLNEKMDKLYLKVSGTSISAEWVHLNTEEC